MTWKLCLLGASLLVLAASLIPAAVYVLSDVPETQLNFVLDAGHGGEDGGAVGADGLLEADVNLAVTLRTDALLGLFGQPAVLTRSSAEIQYPDSASTTRQRKRYDQQSRAALVNTTPGAVLVSIHQNQYPAAQPSGAQVFFGKASGSEALGKTIQANLCAHCGTNRQATPISEDIYLLREAACPAVLIECGFLSNPQELELLRTEPYQTRLSVCIAAGCIGQAAELERCYGKG